MSLPFKTRLKNLLDRIPVEVKYAFVLLLTTRIALTIIGVIAKENLPRVTRIHDWFYTGHVWIDVWSAWDSEWYIRLAQQWYPHQISAEQSLYGFFPLYPLFMKALALLTGNAFVAGIIISNICLFAAAVFLFKLVRITSDEPTALRSIKYLVVFPSAFILSGVFSESLFVMLAVMCFYYAGKENWLMVGVTGCLITLTRSNGILIALPIFYLFCKSKGFSIRKAIPDFLYLGLIPAGLLLFSLYCYLQCGDILAYVHAKHQGWHMTLNQPIKVFQENLRSDLLSLKFNSVFGIVAILILTIFYRRIGFAYWLFGMMTFMLVVCYGLQDPNYPKLAMTSMFGMARFTLDVFPLYIILAQLGANRRIDTALTVSLGALQGVLMILWAMTSQIIV